MAKKSKVTAEEFICTLINPELLEHNANLSMAVVKIFCKDLSAEQLDEVIERIGTLDKNN